MFRGNQIFAKLDMADMLSSATYDQGLRRQFLHYFYSIQVLGVLTNEQSKRTNKIGSSPPTCLMMQISSKRRACYDMENCRNCFPESARLEGPDIISGGRPNSLSSNLLKRPPSKQAIIQARFPRENRARRDSKHRYI